MPVYTSVHSRSLVPDVSYHMCASLMITAFILLAKLGWWGLVTMHWRPKGCAVTIHQLVPCCTAADVLSHLPMLTLTLYAPCDCYPWKGLCWVQFMPS